MYTHTTVRDLHLTRGRVDRRIKVYNHKIIATSTRYLYSKFYCARLPVTLPVLVLVRTVVQCMYADSKICFSFAFDKIIGYFLDHFIITYYSLVIFEPTINFSQT